MTALTKAQQALVVSALPEYGPLAKALARRLGIESDHAVGAMHLSLTESARRFDPTKSERFNGYAYLGVMGAILDAAAKERRESRWSAIAALLLHGLGMAGEVDEEEGIDLAPSVDPTTIAVEELRGRAAAVVAYAVSQPLMAGGETETAAQLDRLRAQRLLQEAVSTLDDAQRQLIELLYAQDATVESVAAALEVSPRTVSRMHLRAREKLGAALRAVASDE